MCGRPRETSTENHFITADLLTLGLQQMKLEDNGLVALSSDRGRCSVRCQEVNLLLAGAG